jgi:alanine racemase
MKTREKEIVNIAEGKSSRTNIEEISSADVDLAQLRQNIDIIRSKLKPQVKFMAVAKGDGYGHGLVPIAEELERGGCDAIGVVRLVEAMALRESEIKIPVLILAPIMPSQASWVVEHDITPMVDNERIIAALEKEASVRDKIINVHVKVNTGLNRYGVEINDALGFIRTIHEKYLHIKVEGIYTHFKDPEFNPQFTDIQLERFNSVLDDLQKEGLRPPIAHAAGSAGILMYPKSHFDMVRCGIILYGIEHKDGEKLLPEGVRPLMSLKSRILKTEKIKAGESGGYGSNFVAKRDSYIAVVGIGYGDGISRGWKEVLVDGQRVPVVNYFMDGILIDITDVVHEVQEFDEVVIVGKQNNETISWEEACHNMNAFIDEQFQRITERVPKHYFYK